MAISNCGIVNSDDQPISMSGSNGPYFLVITLATANASAEAPTSRIAIRLMRASGPIPRISTPASARMTPTTVDFEGRSPSIGQASSTMNGVAS